MLNTQVTLADLLKTYDIILTITTCRIFTNRKYVYLILQQETGLELTNGIIENFTIAIKILFTVTHKLTKLNEGHLGS